MRNGIGITVLDPRAQGRYRQPNGSASSNYGLGTSTCMTLGRISGEWGCN